MMLQRLHRSTIFPVTGMLLALSGGTNSVDAEDFQPKAIVTIEKRPARKVMGSISLPLGAPWCDGKPAYWLVGHQAVFESPWCLVTDATDFDDFDYTDSKWQLSPVAVLDTQDDLNVVDGPSNLDRHDCTTLDVNEDDEPDVVCGVGANKGTGFGYNEVYLTQTEDSGDTPKHSLVKILSDHGLQMFPTMRNRKMVSLEGADGSSLVFLATMGQPRDDGERNQHRMFRLEPSGPHGFSFKHVPGPWIRHTRVSCLHVVDVNQDGLDDILLCNQEHPAFLFLQHSNSTWSRLDMHGARVRDWRNARVADVDGDGSNDLIVVGSGGKTPAETSYIRVFKGSGEPPFFHFFGQAGILYERTLFYSSPDVEVLDVNRDGMLDLYVVQVDEATTGGYCSKSYDQQWSGPQPPTNFTPADDAAPDLLLIGLSTGGFDEVLMTHAKPGCGSLVEQFGNPHTMILAQGNSGRPGHNLLLQW